MKFLLHFFNRGEAYFSGVANIYLLFRRWSQVTRQLGDYREQILLNANQVQAFIDWADKLIESVRDLLKRSGHIWMLFSENI